MAKINDHPRKQGRRALDQLAQRETDVPQSQTELIIRQELVRQGILPKPTEGSGIELLPEPQIEAGTTLTSQLSPTSPFTEEQQHILGQVYCLILSWRKEKKAVKFTSAETENDCDEENDQADFSGSGASMARMEGR
ncbi:MAG: hypothetical protein HYR70_00400 [Chloroflexi bacterium]|nr:hypothetical protein [Chloroflexota bacterium]MBI1854341.1 hypothetical protein [Chloroflexota bacterium]